MPNPANDLNSTYFVPPPQKPDQIREWDRVAIEDYKIPGILLMENAGEACARYLIGELQNPDSPIRAPFHIVCGPGNNGGDGYVIARHLQNRNAHCEIYWIGSGSGPSDATSDAGINFGICESMEISIHREPTPPRSMLDSELREGCFIDAIFGTGLSREVSGGYQEWINFLNRSGSPIVSIDIPSGLDGESGKLWGCAVRADKTLTFVAEKTGFHSEQGPGHTGEVVTLGISIPRRELEKGLQ